jgi:arylformamidase
MAIYDISVPLAEASPVWPGAPRTSLVRISSVAEGDRATKHILTTDVHSGTHVDAPYHFIADGARVDTMDLETLVGPALVVQALEADLLTADVMAALPIPPGTRRLLLHTRNSARWTLGERDFSEDYVAMSEDGAQWLVAHGVRLVGVDYLSIAPFSNTVATHRVLLQAGVVVIEALDLTGIAPGLYQLVCLPLKIAGIEGAPARAILMD